MAKQAGAYYITSCFDNLCFYKMKGKYYVRMKSSLKGKRVKKDAAFNRTMQYAGLLADASSIASSLYKMLPKESKGIAVYRILTGKVMKLLKDGKSANEIMHVLKHPAKPKMEKDVIKKKDKPLICRYPYADAVIAEVFTIVTEYPPILCFEEAPP
jgi:hypothetical protein